MEYLGGISGYGTLVLHGKDIARATYDFEGYQTKHSGITCCGEIRSMPGVLAAIFGQLGIQLRTDSGRLLEIKFSDKRLKSSQDFAHVDVRGEIPKKDKREWNKGRRSESSPSGDVAGRSKMKADGGRSSGTFYSSFGTRDGRSRKVSK